MDPQDAQALLDSDDQMPSLQPVLALPGSSTPAPGQPAPPPVQVAQPRLLPSGGQQFPASADADGQQNIQNLRQGYQQANQQGDIPLDIDSGAPGLQLKMASGAIPEMSWDRLNLAFRRATEDKVKFLQNKYGDKSVRLSTDGVPIFRVLDSKTGKPKDVRETELGSSLNDFVDVAGQFPEIAGGFIAARFGGGPGAVGKGAIPRLANILAMAAGTETAGALKDVGVRAADQSPINLSEIGAERGKMALGDVAMGAAMAAPGMAVKAASKIATPFGEQNELTQQFREALDYFKNKGITLPMTPGEASGSPLLLRTEAMMRQLPGSSAVIKDITDKQNAAMQRIQKVAMGLPADATPAEVQALPTQEATGEKAITAIASKNEAAEKAAAEAKADLAKTGTSEIGSKLAGVVGSGPVDVEQMGGQIRQTALTQRTAFQTQSAEDYNKVYAHPLAKASVFPADSLADDAKRLLKELPARDTITEQPTGILDKFGNEILRDEQGQKIERNFVPSGILPKLNDLASLKGAKFRLGDLLKMRTEVANQIAQGEAVPGVNTHYLSEIRKSLDGAIKDGLDKLPDDSLKNLWETANNNYAKNVKPFQQAGIQELFRTGEQPNFIGNNQVVDRALSGTRGDDTFNAYKQFFGASSPEFTGVKRAVADRLLGSSLRPAGDLVDPIAFMGNLAKLSANSPGVAKEVFGGKSGELLGIAKRMAAGDTGELLTAHAWQQKLNGFVDPDELQRLAASGDLTAQKLAGLVSKEKTVAHNYRNRILKAVGTGDFHSETVKPSEFVRYFSTQGEPEEINQVLGLLQDRPDVTQAIRSKVAQDIFDRAYPASQAIDNPALLSGQPRVLTQTGLQNALGDATQRQRYRSILGADTYNDIEQLTKLLAPRGMSERAFSAAGGLSAGQQIAGLIRGGDLKYISQAAKNWLLAQAYTHPAIRAWAGNTLVPNLNTAGMTRYLIASTPIVEAAYRDFGEKKAKDLMAEMNASAERSKQDTANDPADKYRKLLEGD